MTQADSELRRGAQVEALLDTLETVPVADRESYLVRACSDPEVRAEVLALLAAEPSSTGYVDRFMAGLVPKRPEPLDLAGRRIGAYRLLRLLGRGGMGAVYEAERVDGAFEQRVALKLLTTALAGTEAHERFLAERRILAGLKHSAIAHIVDGGVSEDGTPWFAMEQVDGEPIDAYCDLRELTIRERLELFLQVCDAVEHAHRRLVVHRDLKPANILVTEDRCVKLLDFGIARLLEREEEVAAAPATRTTLRHMTPEYASPEQVLGESITTASDVYQLGLVLYELLIGHQPYSLRSRSPSEIERVVCEQVPARLSAAILHEETLKPTARASRQTAPDETTVEEICRARRSTPTRLQRRLRGDLENIVGIALSKEPERRYGSANSLAKDIRRHLDGLPVEARSDTWIYRGRKYLQRHALGASAAAAALVLAMAMAGLYTVRVQTERDIARAALDRAETEATKAQQISEFLTGLFRGADPREARGAELTARELLDRGVNRIDLELAEQPEVQADMLHVLGRTYLELGIYDAAERLLTRALELRQRHLGPDRSEVTMTLADLGLLRYRQGDYRVARERLEEALAALDASHGSSPEDVADVLRTLGATYRRLGEYEKGKAAFERALVISERQSDVDPESVASTLHSTGALLFDMGDIDRAESLLERALATRERAFGANHLATSTILMDLANIRAVQGELDDLEAMYRRSLAIQRNVYGAHHASVGVVLNNLGTYLVLAGRNEDAIDALRQAVDVYTSAVGAEHPQIAFPLAGLGDAHFALGLRREARRYYRRSVAVRDGAVGGSEFDAVLAHSLARLGRIEAELGNGVAAKRILERALTIWHQAPESVDVQLAPTLVDLGRWLAERQRCADAIPLLRRAIQLQTARRATMTPELAELKSLLVGCS